MNSVRLIKRYQNRKLYDVESSKYITLEELAKIVRSGEEFIIRDNTTQLDITYSTLLQLIFDNEKRCTEPENSEILKRVIRSKTGSLGGYIKFLEMITAIGSHDSEERGRTHRPVASELAAKKPQQSSFESQDTLN
jgi:polyhydroxyalkanoate synthesis repressor PhaR